ncbi:hypothetical protein BDN72DRAFT_965036 [Pluteus cervinus]|uniref:Uncharacterized protein n=1 Tax=Pluteus cervinus TaxID=181527 RepID=A0ACD3A7K0_9AGAR|nr:hypothetical protein BDN72DRAFT_965036 [Pluteus cervinus]
MASDIPPEIVEQIIAHLPPYKSAQYDIQSLALTSRAFVDPCQRRLFQEVDFGLTVLSDYMAPPSTAPPYFFRLLFIFKESPLLAGYVKTLSFPQLGIRGVYAGTGWLIDHPSLFADIVDCLISSRIQTINLKGPYRAPPFDWDQLPLETEINFYCIFSNPSVEVLTMDYMTIPETFFGGFGGLKELELSRVRWARGVAPDFGTHEYRADLQRVQKLTKICLAGEIHLSLDSLTPERGLDLTDVDDATWRIDLPQRAPSLSLLNPAKLKALHLQVFDHSTRPPPKTPPLSLSSCCALSHLIISQHAPARWEHFSTLWTANTISSVPRNALHSLTIRFSSPTKDFQIVQYSGLELLSSVLL